MGFWRWLMSEGWAGDPELHRLLPLPPRELMRRVVGEKATPEFFQKSGLGDAEAFYEQLQAAGFDFTRRAALLDFGCGCARVLRVLARLGDTLELCGADVDAAAIRWCRENLDFARFDALAPRPPSPYPAGRFGAVISYSVFSHLPEELHLRWLAELARITTPGAILVLTTQGWSCAQKFANVEVEDLFLPSPGQMRADLPELAAKGFVFYPYPSDFNESLPESERDSGLHGMTFVLPSYIRARWQEWFDVIQVDEAPRGWQDEVVLRRR